MIGRLENSFALGYVIMPYMSPYISFYCCAPAQDYPSLLSKVGSHLYW